MVFSSNTRTHRDPRWPRGCVCGRGGGSNNSVAAGDTQLISMVPRHRFCLIAGSDNGDEANPGPGIVQAFARDCSWPPHPFLMAANPSQDCTASRPAGAVPIGVTGHLLPADEPQALADQMMADISDLAGLPEQLDIIEFKGTIMTFIRSIFLSATLSVAAMFGTAQAFADGHMGAGHHASADAQKMQIFYELKIKPGKADELRAIAREMVAFNDAGEPNTMAYNVYMNEDETLFTFLELFTDVDAVIFHGDRFATGSYVGEVLERTDGGRLVIYGGISQRLKDWGTENGFEMEFFGPIDGFYR